MDIDKDRRLAMNLAKAAGATKTHATLTNRDACYEHILRTGVAEAGLDALVSAVLQGPPAWAQKTLLYIPNVGPYRGALLKKAAEAPESALETLRFINNLGSHRRALLKAAGQLALTAPISKFNLRNDGWFACEFTLNWIRDDRLMPESEYPSWNSWVWSREVPISQDTGILDVTDFQLENAPIQPGDLIWMVLWIRSGIPDIVQASIQFKYDPNVDPAANTANFVASGTTQSVDLSLKNISGSGGQRRRQSRGKS